MKRQAYAQSDVECTYSHFMYRALIAALLGAEPAGRQLSHTPGASSLKLPASIFPSEMHFKWKVLLARL